MFRRGLLLVVFVTCAALCVSGQGDPKYARTTAAQYLELGRWLFGKDVSPSQVWGAKNCDLYGAFNTCADQSLVCLHTGVDYPGTRGTTPVLSVTDGVVIAAVPGCPERRAACLSWIAVYNAATDTTFFYLHLETLSAGVGQAVSAGQRLGTVGERGYSTKPHLHFEARVGRKTHAAVCVASTENPYERAASARSAVPGGRLSISGRVAASGRGLPGVSIAVSGQPGSAAVTDAAGTYAVSGLSEGSYVLTPTKGGYSFAPASRSVTLAATSLTSQDFVANAAGQPPTPLSVTATILVMDVSGSMAWQWKGGVKIESAKKAAMQFVEEVANEPRPQGSSHMIAVVTFSDSASLLLPLTDDYDLAKRIIISLGTVASTNLGAGLGTGLRELDRFAGATKRFVILLSDGNTNTGITRDQILSGPVAEARKKGICIHAVAYGDKGDVDEDFLRKIAVGSGCGTYNLASTGLQLFGTYIKVRHAMLGSNRIVQFTSGTDSTSGVYLVPGQAFALGAFQLTAAAEELHYTLAWSGSGTMRAKLVDPSGKEVTSMYPRAQFYSGSGFQHVTVFSPQVGFWRAAAVAGSGSPQRIEYYAVASARTGGYVIPYDLPKICITEDICFPLPDMPTLLVVGIVVAAVAFLLYQQFVAP